MGDMGKPHVPSWTLDTVRQSLHILQCPVYSNFRVSINQLSKASQMEELSKALTKS